MYFRNNPVQQAQEELATSHTNLKKENESLKARIRLLEEGQSKDLTMIVGQKVEESQELTGRSSYPWAFF